jgi:uncharacterized protein (UPF0332 family)
VDWLLYYDVALEWVGNDGEAHKRSAVSRAYYAMFCTARNELKDNIDDEYSPPKCGSEHKYVWNLYKKDRHPRGTRQIVVLGDRLRHARNRADYCDFVVNFSDLVENAMDDAEALKGHLKDLRV